jgi:hypothetical protein
MKGTKHFNADQTTTTASISQAARGRPGFTRNTTCACVGNTIRKINFYLFSGGMVSSARYGKSLTEKRTV